MSGAWPALPQALAIVLFLLGLSYLLLPSSWLRLWRRILAEPAAFRPLFALMTALGLLLALGHDNWRGSWNIFITVFGWLLALEGAALLLRPTLVLPLKALPDRFMRLYFFFGGLLLCLIGAGLGWRFFGAA